MEDKRLLSLKDFEGLSFDPNWSKKYIFLEVCRVAAQKKEEEALRQSVIKKNRGELKNSVVGVSSSKHEEILMKERALKKPMTEPVAVAIPKKHRSERNTGGRNGLKRSYGERSFQGDDIDFKNQNKSKRKEENVSMRSKKLDMPNLPNPPPDLPEEFKRRIEAMGGTQVVMVIQKALFYSDIDRDKNRLSMPLRQINKDFLIELPETESLAQHETLTVQFIEPSREVNEMMLGQWDMKTSSQYVLKKHWNDVVKKNGLKEDDVVQVWSFRVGIEQDLGFALVVVSRSADIVATREE